MLQVGEATLVLHSTLVLEEYFSPPGELFLNWLRRLRLSVLGKLYEGM